MIKGELFDSVVTHGDNDSFRIAFVDKWLMNLDPGDLLDVGSGLMPFRDISIQSGHNYKSHDFEKYYPDKQMPGLVESQYILANHDFVSDILDLPESMFDYALCTEVLEHVPDPVAAIKSVMLSLRIGGLALFTVPMRSQIHQAPYFYSAGLSPFWFSFHADANEWAQVKVLVVGDQLDSLINEIPAIMRNWRFRRWHLGAITRAILIRYFKLTRDFYSSELKSSGGLGVYAILRRVK